VYRLIERDPSSDFRRGGCLRTPAFRFASLEILWIAGPPDRLIACRDRALLQRMERIKHYLSICNAAPSEALPRSR